LAGLLSFQVDNTLTSESKSFDFFMPSDVVDSSQTTITPASPISGTILIPQCVDIQLKDVYGNNLNHGSGEIVTVTASGPSAPVFDPVIDVDGNGLKRFCWTVSATGSYTFNAVLSWPAGSLANVDIGNWQFDVTSTYTPSGTVNPPTASLKVPSQVLAAASFKMDLTLNNAGGTGFQPMFDFVTSRFKLNTAAWEGQVLTLRCVSSASSPITVPHPILGALVPNVNLAANEELCSAVLPLGSYAPGSPAIQITLTATGAATADVTSGLTSYLKYRAGYALGNVPTGGSPILGSFSSQQTVSMQLYFANIVHDADRVTGDCHNGNSTVSLVVANGITIQKINFTVIFPNNVAFVGGYGPSSSVINKRPTGVTISSPLVPSANVSNAPNNVLEIYRTLGLVGSGQASGDIQWKFAWYAPQFDFFGASVLNPFTAAPVNTTFGISVTLQYTNDQGLISSFSQNVLTVLKALRVEKTPSLLSDHSGNGYSAQDTLTWAITLTTSRYFTFGDLFYSDNLGDGERYLASPIPTFQVIPCSTYNFDAGTPLITLDTRRIGQVPVAGLTLDGSTFITFDAETLSNDALVGSCASAVLRFTAEIQEFYSNAYGAAYNRQPYVAQGDVLYNNAFLDYTVRNQTDTFTVLSNGQIGAAGSITIAAGVLTSEIYARNGAICSPSCPASYTVGDQITWRIKYALPSADFQNLELSMYWIYPLFDVSVFTGFDSVTSSTPPALGRCKFGPTGSDFPTLDMYSFLESQVIGSGTPAFSVNTASNGLKFNYGSRDNPNTEPKTIDIICTAQAGSWPYPDVRALNFYAGSTEAGVENSVIVPILVREPLISTMITSVLSTNRGTPLTTPLAPYQGLFASATCSAGTRFLVSPDFSQWDNVNAPQNVDGLDQGDAISFAIIATNTGTGDAYDINIKATLPPCLAIPALIGCTSITAFLRVTDGRNSATGITVTGTITDLFGTAGLTISKIPGIGDPAFPPPKGTNILVITFDLQVASSYSPNTSPCNGCVLGSAQLISYAATPGGQNFLAPSSPPGGGTGYIANSPTTRFPTITFLSVTLTITQAYSNCDLATTGPDLTAGEPAAYTLTFTFPEGVSSGVDLYNQFFLYANDGSALIPVPASGNCFKIISYSTPVVGSGLATVPAPLPSWTAPSITTFQPLSQFSTYPTITTVTNAATDNSYGAAASIVVSVIGSPRTASGTQSPQNTWQTGRQLIVWGTAKSQCSSQANATFASTLYLPTTAETKTINVGSYNPGTFTYTMPSDIDSGTYINFTYTAVLTVGTNISGAHNYAVLECIPTGWNIASVLLVNPVAGGPEVQTAVTTTLNSAYTSTLIAPVGRIANGQCTGAVQVVFSPTSILSNQATLQYSVPVPNVFPWNFASTFYSDQRIRSAGFTATGPCPTNTGGITNNDLRTNPTFNRILQFTNRPSFFLTQINSTENPNTLGTSLTFGECGTFVSAIRIPPGQGTSVSVNFTLSGGLSWLGATFSYTLSTVTTTSASASISGTANTILVISFGTVNALVGANGGWINITNAIVANVNSLPRPVDGQALNVTESLGSAQYNITQTTVQIATLTVPVLSRSLISSITTLQAGDAPTFTATITNTGSAAAADVAVSIDVLTSVFTNPGSVNILQAPSGFSQSVAGSLILVSTTTLLPGNSIIFTYSVTVLQSVGAGGTILQNMTVSFASNPASFTCGQSLRDLSTTTTSILLNIRRPTVSPLLTSSCQSETSDALGQVAIGERITLETSIVVPFGTIAPATLQITWPTNRLTYLSSAFISFDPNIQFTPSSPTQTVLANGVQYSWTQIINPPPGGGNNTLKFVVNAEVSTDPANTPLSVIGVNSMFSYGSFSDTATTNLTVVSPNIITTLTKNRNLPLQFGDTIIFTLKLNNSLGSGPAIDVGINFVSIPGVSFLSFSSSPPGTVVVSSSTAGFSVRFRLYQLLYPTILFSAFL